MKAKREKQKAAEVSELLKASENNLIRAVCDTDVLTIREAGKLVAMQRKMRALRYDVEVKAGIW